MATDKFAKFVHSKRHISTNFLAFCLKNNWTEKNRMFLFDCRSLGEYDRICINDSISVNVLAPILLKRLIVNDTLPLTILVPNCNGQREIFEKFHKTALIVLVVNPTDTFTAEKLYEKFLACDCDVALLNGKVTDFLSEYPQYRATTTAVITFNTSNANIPHSDLYSDSDSTNLNSVSESLINISLASPSVDMKLDDVQPSPSNGGRSGGLTPLEMPPSDWNANENCTPGDENASKRGNGNLFNCRFPVQVMPHLYLGNAENASDLNTLKKNGIKYVLNVTPDLPNTFEKDENFKYMKIPVDDHWSENLSEYFPQAFNFIDEGRHQGVGVLVHCWAGISRSVTVIVAYLMRTLNLSMDDAYDRVKSHKPNIAPNFNFMGQLLDYQRDLYGENVPAGDSSSSVGSPPVDNECPLSPSNNNGDADSRRQQPIDENSLKTIPKPESSTCR